MKRKKRSFGSRMKDMKRPDLYVLAAGFGIDPLDLATLEIRDVKRAINTARVVAITTGKNTIKAAYGAYRQESAGVKWKLEPCFDFLIKDLRVFKPQGA